MIPPIKFSLLIFFLLHSYQSTLAQSYKYEIYKGNKPIGNILTKKLQKGDYTEYIIESNATFRIIFEFSTQFKFEASFLNGKLCRSFTKNMLNDSERESTEITWENGKYKLVKDNEEVSFLEIKRPEYAMANLYYQEPTEVSEVFSERFGEYLPIKSMGKKQSELTLPDGKTNIYTYENGRCSEVKVNHMLATLYFKLMP